MAVKLSNYNLSYPSLLESSDVDGGSTPAVITYLSRILESIDQPELIHRILHFLLASPSEEASEKRKPAKKPKMSVSRRKSLDLLATFALAAAIPSPTLFNLVDLVSMSIKSHNNQTLVATLKLITIIVQQHHHFANALIKASPTSAETSCKLRTLGGLNAELQQLIGFATMIDDSPSLDRSYSSYLANASSVLAPRILSMGWNDSTGMSRLHVDDIIFRGMLDHLSHFFTNNVITNLALTSAIAALATSNLISLDGWLLVPPDKYQFTHSSDATTNSSDEDTFESSSANSQHQDTEQPLKSAYKQPLLSNASADLPALILVLRNLVDQLHAWREAIPDFNVLLAGRRDLLRVSDDGGGGGEHDAATEGQHSIEAANSGAGMAIDTEDSRGRRRNVLQGQGPRSGSGLSTVPSPGNPQHSTAMTVSGTVHSVPDFVSSSPARTSVSQSRSPSAAMGTAVMSTAATYIPIDLHRRLANTLSTELGQSRPSPVGKESHSDPTSTGSDDDENGSATSTSVNGKDITLGHVLTNVVILYEFVLELAALVQMRASIFAEVGFY